MLTSVPAAKYRLWSYRYRLLLGVVLVILTCLDAGDMPDVAADLLGYATDGAAIYWLSSDWSFMPITFAILASVNVVDVILFFLRIYDEHKKQRSAVADPLDTLPTISQGQKVGEGKDPDRMIAEDETALKL